VKTIGEEMNAVNLILMTQNNFITHQQSTVRN